MAAFFSCRMHPAGYQILCFGGGEAQFSTVHGVVFAIFKSSLRDAPLPEHEAVNASRYSPCLVGPPPPQSPAPPLPETPCDRGQAESAAEKTA